jgi:hypothetical protein
VAATPKKKMAKKVGLKRLAKKSLAQTNPDLAKEADGWESADISPFSHKKLPWICPKGHKYEASVANRSKGRGCPYCSGNKVLVGESDLATTNPFIAKQAYGWNASEFSAGSSERKQWRCNLGHIWVARIADRCSGTGCPICSGKILLQGFNDLATTHPHLAIEANGWKAADVYAGSHKKLSWKCSKGHEWKASVSNRSRLNVGCPYCSGQKLLTGFNDLATTFPSLANEADGWDATRVSAGSNQSAAWICSKGHRWSAQISSRKYGRDCPICAGTKVLQGYNDLGTMNPKVAEQANGWDVTAVSPGSNSKRGWKCEKGHTWTASISSRTSGRNCPYCSNQKVLEGFNDLGCLFPTVSAEADGWDAHKVVAKSGTKRKWKCSQGHIWSISPNARVPNGTNCPSCAKFGFDPNKRGYLYLLRHENWELFKIGISNSPTMRTASHEERGWEVMENKGPMDGLLAYEWEQSILKMLKNHGADLGREDIAGKFDGYTESWVARSFPVTSIKELMDLVHEDENKSLN